MSNIQDYIELRKSGKFDIHVRDMAVRAFKMMKIVSEEELSEDEKVWRHLMYVEATNFLLDALQKNIEKILLDTIS